MTGAYKNLTYVLYVPRIFIFNPTYNVNNGIEYISNNIGCYISNFSTLAATDA